MKIAAITLTYNDDYKFNEWYNHYTEYKDDLYLHIIVDNNSNKNYLKKVKETFTESYIIERESNGGCTGAYNDAIEYALSIPDIDSIMLIANDIRLKKGAVSILHKTMLSDSKMGMIAPIFLRKDSDIVDDFGCKISNTLIMQPYCKGRKIENIKESINYCEAVTGGMNLAKREFYETVGLQDNKLFMYSDEVDMGIRAKDCGFTMAVISDAVSWHQHINKNVKSDRRDPYTQYLAGRNKVYVAKKHFGTLRVLYVFLFYVFGAFYKIIINLFKGNFSGIKEYVWLIYGAVKGGLGDMKPNKFSVPREDTIIKR